MVIVFHILRNVFKIFIFCLWFFYLKHTHILFTYIIQYNIVVNNNNYEYMPQLFFFYIYFETGAFLLYKSYIITKTINTKKKHINNRLRKWLAFLLFSLLFFFFMYTNYVNYCIRPNQKWWVCVCRIDR